MLKVNFVNFYKNTSISIVNEQRSMLIGQDHTFSSGLLYMTIGQALKWAGLCNNRPITETVYHIRD